jgi:hypothetical protein
VDLAVTVLLGVADEHRAVVAIGHLDAVTAVTAAEAGLTPAVVI